MKYFITQISLFAGCIIMAHRLLRDVEADGWERSDFPIICESCLGDNPYLRMVNLHTLFFVELLLRLDRIKTFDRIFVAFNFEGLRLFMKLYMHMFYWIFI